MIHYQKINKESFFLDNSHSLAVITQKHLTTEFIVLPEMCQCGYDNPDSLIMKESDEVCDLWLHTVMPWQI